MSSWNLFYSYLFSLRVGLGLGLTFICKRGHWSEKCYRTRAESCRSKSGRSALSGGESGLGSPLDCVLRAYFFPSLHEARVTWTASGTKLPLSTCHLHTPANRGTSISPSTESLSEHCYSGFPFTQIYLLVLSSAHTSTHTIQGVQSSPPILSMSVFFHCLLLLLLFTKSHTPTRNTGSPYSTNTPDPH